MSGVILLLPKSRGIYIPRDFVEKFDMQAWHVDEKYVGLLSSPDDNEFYWDYWDVVCHKAFFLDKDGNKWVLQQDGDLFAICHELLTDEEKLNLGWEIDWD